MQGETPFIALELLHGETLEEFLIRERRVSIPEVLRIGREIASGLAAAHARGLLHRDIKPANIWLERPETSAPGRPVVGKVKILDFGCAKSSADEVAISEQGLLTRHARLHGPGAVFRRGRRSSHGLVQPGLPCIEWPRASGPLVEKMFFRSCEHWPWNSPRLFKPSIHRCRVLYTI
jgi:serine/threonine protein kinase